MMGILTVQLGCIEQLSNKKIECVVIDTMGIDARIKSILSSYHGRYRILFKLNAKIKKNIFTESLILYPFFD
jgi:hypothetical protein